MENQWIENTTLKLTQKLLVEAQVYCCSRVPDTKFGITFDFRDTWEVNHYLTDFQSISKCCEEIIQSEELPDKWPIPVALLYLARQIASEWQGIVLLQALYFLLPCLAGHGQSDNDPDPQIMLVLLHEATEWSKKNHNFSLRDSFNEAIAQVALALLDRSLSPHPIYYWKEIQKAKDIAKDVIQYHPVFIGPESKVVKL